MKHVCYKKTSLLVNITIVWQRWQRSHTLKNSFQQHLQLVMNSLWKPIERKWALCDVTKGTVHPKPPFSGLALQNISKCGRSNGATVLSGSCKRRTKRSGSVKWEFYGTFQATREPKETDLTTLESFTLYFTVRPRQTEEKPETKPGRRGEY